MLALITLATTNAAACPSYTTCKDWSCKTWCSCFDEKVEAAGLYAKAGCSDDGPACDCTKVQSAGDKICYTAWFSETFHDTRQCREMYSYGKTFNEILRRSSFRDIDISRSGSKSKNELGRSWSGYGEARGRARLEMRMLAWWFDSDRTGKYIDNDYHDKDMEHLARDYRGHTGCVETECRDGLHKDNGCRRKLGKNNQGYDSTGRASRVDQDPNTRIYVEMDAWEDDFGIRTNGRRYKQATKVTGAAWRFNRDAQKYLNCKHNDWHSFWERTRDNSKDFFTDDCRVSDKHRFQDLGKITDLDQKFSKEISNNGHGVVFNVNWRHC